MRACLCAFLWLTVAHCSYDQDTCPVLYAVVPNGANVIASSIPMAPKARLSCWGASVQPAGAGRLKGCVRSFVDLFGMLVADYFAVTRAAWAALICMLHVCK